MQLDFSIGWCIVSVFCSFLVVSVGSSIFRLWIGLLSCLILVVVCFSFLMLGILWIGCSRLCRWCRVMCRLCSVLLFVCVFRWVIVDINVICWLIILVSSLSMNFVMFVFFFGYFVWVCVLGVRVVFGVMCVDVILDYWYCYVYSVVF